MKVGKILWCVLRRRNTARRRLAGAGTGAGLISVSSDPHLATSGPSCGFPPGTTVDELHWFSRRKVDSNNRYDFIWYYSIDEKYISF